MSQEQIAFGTISFTRDTGVTKDATVVSSLREGKVLGKFRINFEIRSSVRAGLEVEVVSGPFGSFIRDSTNQQVLGRMILL